MIKKVLKAAVRRTVRPNRAWDVGYGFRLLKDRQVPLTAKMLALAVGIALTGLLLAFEVPLEGLIALLLPGAGIATDVMVDGLELLIVPVLLASLAMVRLAPRALRN